MDIAGFGHCVNNQTDCYAFCNGRCRVLNNGDFNGRKCPFYKNKEEKEKEEWQNRLKNRW